MGELPRVQTAVDQDAMGAPESIVEVLEAGMPACDPSLFHGELLAPHRPSLVEDGVGTKPSDAARMPVLDRELKVVTRVSLVGARQFQTVVLTFLAEPFRRIFLGGTEVIHPEDAALTLLKGPR
jgi:hypothetical protein